MTGTRADPDAVTASASSTAGPAVLRRRAGRGRAVVGKYLPLAYLPPEHAVVGTDLEVMHMRATGSRPVSRRRQHAARSTPTTSG